MSIIIKTMKSIAYYLLLYITYGFWVVFGFMLWLPVLVMNMAVFCGLLIYNMVINNPSSTQNGQDNLDYAASFYLTGFKKITYTLQQDVVVEKAKDKYELRIARFILYSIWVLVFWGAITLFLYLKVSHSPSNTSIS